MRALKQFLSKLNQENKQLLIIVICFLGDLINALLIYLEISDFKNFQRLLSHSASDMANYQDILNAPEFQVQVYQILIQFTVTTLGLIIVFHSAIYYFFIKKKKMVVFYLKLLTIGGMLFTVWFGLKSLALNPLYSVVTIYSFLYFLAFMALIDLYPNSIKPINTEVEKQK